MDFDGILAFFEKKVSQNARGRLVFKAPKILSDFWGQNSQISGILEAPKFQKTGILELKIRNIGPVGIFGFFEHFAQKT